MLLFKVNKNLKVDLNGIHLLLSLMVNLWVKDSRKIVFDAKKIVEGKLELWHKNWFLIIHDRIWMLVVIYYNIGNNFG